MTKFFNRILGIHQVGYARTASHKESRHRPGFSILPNRGNSLFNRRAIVRLIAEKKTAAEARSLDASGAIGPAPAHSEKKHKRFRFGRSIFGSVRHRIGSISSGIASVANKKNLKKAIHGVSTAVHSNEAKTVFRNVVSVGKTVGQVAKTITSPAGKILDATGRIPQALVGGLEGVTQFLPMILLGGGALALVMVLKK